MTTLLTAALLTVVISLMITCEARKPFTLKLLQMLPPQMGINPFGVSLQCRWVGDVVVDLINKRHDILPDYHIELVNAAEHLGGSHTTVGLMEFIRNHNNINNNTFISPVVVSGIFSPGCKAIGAFLHQLGLVSFSPACSSEVLLNRRLYPNLYLTSSIAQEIAHGQLQVIRNLGKWQRFAILAYLGNANDYGAANFLLKIAIENQLHVVYYDGIMDFQQDPTSSIDALKKSGARIIVFWTTVGALAWQFLCLCHQRGMTGNRYIFMINGPIVADSKTVPGVIAPGCIKATVLEQYRYTIGVGDFQVPIVKNVTTAIGYDADGFDKMLDDYTNKTRAGDYSFRFQYHDAILAALMTLNTAENALKANYNMTLRDFHNNKQTVMKIVNDSARNLEMVGLRVAGPMKYGDSGVLATDYVSILRPTTNSTDLAAELIGVVRQLLGTNVTGHSNNDFALETWKPYPWTTANGQPPRDSADFLENVETIPISAFIVLISVALISTLFLAFGFVKVAKKRTRDCLKILAIFCCFLLNITGVLFSIETEWNLRVVFLVSSVSLTNGLLFGRVVATRIAAINQGEVAFRQTTRRHGRRRKIVIRVTLKDVALLTFSFVAINLVLTTIWLAVDPLKCSRTSLEPVYDEQKDLFVATVLMTCESSSFGWQIALTSFNAAVLTAGCFYAYGCLSHRRQLRRQRLKIPEVVHMSAGVLNAFCILAMAVTIIIIVRRHPYQQQLTVAVLCHVFSATTFATLFIWFR